MDTEIRRRLRWVELFPKVRGCFEFLETGEEEMVIDKEIIDRLLADYKGPEDLIGEQGLLTQLTKAAS
jgi:hypothetical protein